MCCMFPNLPIICLAYMQQLLKGTQYHSSTRAAAFTVKTGRLLDICGPMQTQSFGGSRYFITFTDDYSRYCKIYFLEKKSEALEKLEFKASVENEFEMKIKALRADRGGEYLSNEFSIFSKNMELNQNSQQLIHPNRMEYQSV